MPCTRAAPAPNPGGRSAQIRELRPNPSPINHEARWQQVPNFYGLWDSLKFIGNRPGARQCSKPKASSEGCFPASPGSRPCQGAYTPSRAQESRQPVLGGTTKPLPKSPGSKHSAFLRRKKVPSAILGDGLSSPGYFPLLVIFPSYSFLLLDVFSLKIPPARDYFPHFHMGKVSLESAHKSVAFAPPRGASCRERG